MKKKGLVLGGFVIGSSAVALVPLSLGSNLLVLVLWTTLGGFSGSYFGLKLANDSHHSH